MTQRVGQGCIIEMCGYRHVEVECRISDCFFARALPIDDDSSVSATARVYGACG